MTTLRALAALLVLCPALAACGAESCNPRYELCADPSSDDADLYLASTLDAEYSVDPSLTAHEVEALSEAAALWDAATGGRARLRLVMTSDGDALPERRVARRAFDGELDEGMLASYWGEQVRVSPEAGESPQLLGIMIHELGHRVGLGHEPDPASVMYGCAHSEMPNEVTPDALEDFDALYR